jgi:hypothetical protein
MRIGERSSSATARLLRIFILVAIFALGLWLGAHIDGVRISLPVQMHSASPAGNDALPVLTVDMSFENYNTLLQQRETALDVGVYIPRDADFVTATLQVQGLPYSVLDDTTPPVVPVNMRFAPGVVDHLADDARWEFEVRTRQQQYLWGMQRFQLRDPADNNWINEWLFAQALRRDGLLAARYHFVRLIFNGEDRGIYAVQEGFAEDLFLTQRREAGVIVEFDTDLLWQSIAHFGTARQTYADPITNLSANNFQLFEVNAFRDAEIDRDPALAAQRDSALGLLRALQTGELPASQVFDVERYGRFLALVDLWGATQGTALTNLRYYYDPTTGRLEPIGFNAGALGSEGRVDLAATYNDAQLQAAYVREADRVSQTEYLDALQTALEPAFRDLQRTLGSEGIALDPPWERLRERQQAIQRSLNPVQPVFAFLGDPRQAMSNTLSVAVGNIINAPVEIVGFDINGTAFLPAERQWLQPTSETLLALPEADAVLLSAFDAAQAPVIRYAHFNIPLTAIHRVDAEIDFLQEPEIAVVVRLAGLSQTHVIPARYGSPDVFVVTETE